MVLPETYWAGLLLAILSLICWGSWANSYKLAGKWRFELYYWDYAIGALLAVTVAAFTFGTLGFDGFLFTDDLMRAGKHNMLYGFIAGGIFNLGNMLLVAAMSVAGMSVAFPLGMGLALIIGVVWSYLVQPLGNPALLFGGAAMVLAAMVLASIAHRSFELARSEAAIRAGKTKSIIPKARWRGVLLGLASGVFLGSFYPLVATCRRGENGLGPYALAFVFAGGIFCSTFVYNLFFMNLPVEGEPVEVLDYFKGTGRQHALGIVGGILWAIGTLASFVVSSAPDVHLGPVTNSAMGPGAALLAALWGVVAWREFRGAESQVKVLVTMMLALFAGGAALVSLAPGYPRW